MPDGDAVHRSVPCRAVGHRRPGRSASRSVEPAATQLRSRRACRGPEPQERPLRAVEEARGSDRNPTGQARFDPALQPSTVAGLSAQGATPLHRADQGSGRCGHARSLAGLGPTITAPLVRRARSKDPTPPHRHRSCAHPSPQQRSDRVGQHSIASTPPSGLRLPLRRARHRPRLPQARRPLSSPPSLFPTPGNVRSARFSLGGSSVWPPQAGPSILVG